MMSRRPGVTFVELVMVVLILGIAAAIAAPRYVDSYERFRVEAAAKRIVADLERARTAAYTTGTNATVEFDTDSNQYTLLGVGDMDRSSADPVTRLAETGYPAVLVSVDFNGDARLNYDMYGRPWAGSPLAELASGTIVIQAGNRQQTIIVNPATGQPRVQ